MYPRMFWLVCGVLSITVSLAGCGGNAAKEATEAAVNAAQTAIAGIQGEAAKYVPDQLSAAQNAIQSANAALAKGDLQTALTDAREAIDKAKVLESASAEKKDELTKDWSRFTQTFPKTLEAVHWRIEAYSHGAKLPPGLDQQILDDAKTQYAALKQSWSDASATFQQGDLVAACQKASALKDALPKLIESLGMKIS
ncbi:MAG TPA: hypothetical protein VGF19_15270 [Candidatus Acidoferrum sp.]